MPNCWEYKESIKKMPNKHMKHTIQQSYNLHIDFDHGRKKIL